MQSHREPSERGFTLEVEEAATASLTRTRVDSAVEEAAMYANEVEEGAMYAFVLPLLTYAKLYPLDGPPIRQGWEPHPCIVHLA